MPKDAITQLTQMYADLTVSMAGAERFSIEGDIVDNVCETRWLKSALTRMVQVDSKRNSHLERRVRWTIHRTATAYLATFRKLATKGKHKGKPVRVFAPAPGYPGFWQLQGAFNVGEIGARRRQYQARVEYLKTPLEVTAEIEAFLTTHPAASASDAEAAVFGT